MAIRAFLGMFAHVPTSQAVSTLGRGQRAYAVLARVNKAVEEGLGAMKKLNFEEFKREKVKSFGAYRDSEAVQELFGSDVKKISKSYEDYCRCKFNRYQITLGGGNPATMI